MARRKELRGVTIGFGDGWSSAYLEDAARQMAEAVDRAIIGRVQRFLTEPLKQDVQFWVDTHEADLRGCVPELWAKSALAALVEHSQIADKINRDFSEQTNNFGRDRINVQTRRLGS